MSIATRTGDDGTTGLMYNRRVSKTHLRVEAYGSVDELNAALGSARAHGADEPFIAESILKIQTELVKLMGELATAIGDRERFVRDGYSLITPEQTEFLDSLVREIEAQKVSFKGWATPGANLSSAALDVARTTCRRAERRVHALREAEELPNLEIPVYLNRLSDVLWLMARWVETKRTPTAGNA